MEKVLIYSILCALSLGLAACSKQPSKVEQLRQEKHQRDSVNYAQAKQNAHYSDSLLQVLLPQVDPLLKNFVYSKNAKVEDHGRYVHRLLQTSSNVSRTFLQAYVADNKMTSVQSYYCGANKLNQRSIHLSVGEDYVEKEGSNHAFNVEGWHEILTVQGDDALTLLAYVSNHVNEPVHVQCKGGRTVSYVLSPNERKALDQTYQLAVLMRNIDALERAIHVANLQIQKYEKKHANHE